MITTASIPPTLSEIHDAIQAIANCARSIGYEQILISQTGGVSFHRVNLLDQLIELHEVTAQLQQEQSIAVG
ncbi:hypothetical protein [Leptolyngbya sp. FACHB-16]|uniref:hypothetical protein n=1 Tax=unclassified Leptolyngbya TaxID=2650499 RepID=UPI0016898C27|nr:hypothetical protein [Leptolyngbya sp. FACHB-16]MBD2153127.1 hypothetical protein [Leptolyngbya sp. FACHB-16]